MKNDSLSSIQGTEEHSFHINNLAKSFKFGSKPFRVMIMFMEVASILFYISYSYSCSFSYCTYSSVLTPFGRLGSSQINIMGISNKNFIAIAIYVAN